jgi:hypothetical protein
MQTVYDAPKLPLSIFTVHSSFTGEPIDADDTIGMVWNQCFHSLSAAFDEVAKVIVEDCEKIGIDAPEEIQLEVSPTNVEGEPRLWYVNHEDCEALYVITRTELQVAK